MELLKNSLTIRGDSLYCPLAFSLDSYGNCLTDCHHCWVRHLNHTWGKELKPADIPLLEKKLKNGLKNKTPKSPISYCLSLKKTIRWGNKTDPFQEVEKKHKLAPKIFNLFSKYSWTFVIQTRFTDTLLNYEKYIIRSNNKKLITIMPVISPGLEYDWEVFERKRTTPPIERLKNSKYLKKLGVPLGINGEPFIPGVHKIYDFEKTLILLKEYGIDRYNTYNFHFNSYVAKRLNNIKGIDIEKIWYYNQDSQWKKILSRLLDLAKKYNIKLGCPDFVNTGMKYVDPANTCCGVDVPNPCTFNSHYFKKYKQSGCSNNKIFSNTYDGTGNLSEGKAIIEGTNKKMYNLKDI